MWGERKRSDRRMDAGMRSGWNVKGKRYGPVTGLFGEAKKLTPMRPQSDLERKRIELEKLKCFEKRS